MLDALRLGVHQLLSTRVASHAAVNESVELARGAGGRGAAGFANAVLRRVARDTPGDWMTHVAESARSDDEQLGLLFSHPVWVVRAFRRALAAEGRAEELEALLTADNASPRVTMAALPDLADVPDDARRTPFSPIGFRLGGGDPDSVVRGSGGRIRVQDEGSQLAALALTRALPVAPGERWLDLCAGPGGKTAVLAAEALAHGASLEANEISPARAGLVRQALAGVPLDVPGVGRGRPAACAGRPRHLRPHPRRRALHGPRRAPPPPGGALAQGAERRSRRSPQLQRELLTEAVGALKPGGVVAYITCSPHLAETAGVVADIRREWDGAVEELSARDVITSLADADPGLPPQADGSGRAQLWPHRHNTDAMSVTLLRRV